ncbi:hypothetical protein G6F16_005000 [Rhizopus arrhizus]|nr:hypothetical protein G6F24_005989 [Rhizopus arrhizus]KAG0793447.1 hypothetical protein G6F21_003612 [Rhizopus arrhizus]KAG0799903.1 hypothetical protein G6F22_002767 [Rhizopus arrhizus]KAG0814611.1 hypothetical protein G6F20_004641 [Rhizopus arrhizus]KAG0835093.1 hypothetical protein G6F19_004877 [Rhizopus arrhizus]
MKFRDTIYTDGVGVLVLKQNYNTKKKGGSSGGKSKSIEADESQHLRSNLKRDKVIAAELSLSHFKSSTVNKDRFVEYLQERAKITPLMKAYYLNEDRPVEEDQRAGGFLPFRKMKLSSFTNQQQSDKRLVKKLREKFGDDAILIVGNWSAGNNPKPYQREKYPIADRHVLVSIMLTKNSLLPIVLVVATKSLATSFEEKFVASPSSFLLEASS